MESKIKTKDILSVIRPGTVVNIYQMPIESFHKSGAEVHRQTGEVGTLIASNQNYLEFDVVGIEQRGGLITIICKANPSQEKETILAFYNGKLLV